MSLLSGAIQLKLSWLITIESENINSLSILNNLGEADIEHIWEVMGCDRMLQTL